MNKFKKEEKMRKDMEDINLELRQFHDGTWSVIARVFTPSKKFYEHPEFINLTKKEAEKRCNELIEEKVSMEEVLSKWVYIGNLIKKESLLGILFYFLLKF